MSSGLGLPIEIDSRAVTRSPPDFDSMTDESFDEVYPPWARELSRIHWTPIAVARRAARLLVAHEGARILDVGSGAGKFCIVGAAITKGYFVGIEQRDNLVRVARRAARRHGAVGCQFVHGNAVQLDWRPFDGFYLYNPFAEHRPSYRPIDTTIEIAPRHYDNYVSFVEAQLARAATGTRLVTYWGFGGMIPSGWREYRTGPGISPLTLWIKEPRGGKVPRPNVRSALAGTRCMKGG
jgi:SAM-dependent methyltransferase